MLKDKIVSFLEKIDQRQLAFGLNRLSFAEQETFLHELESYGTVLIDAMRKTLFHPPAPTSFEPLKQYAVARREKQGEVGLAGCLILCGGQGSRLQADSPKALFPITWARQKTLLQFFCEKAVAASKKSGRLLPVAIMTSPLNHSAIASYLEEHERFGLEPSQVDLFSQAMLPFVDNQGSWMLQAPGKIAQGPDGNGYALHHFHKQGLCEKWKKLGIDCMTLIPIDNPLADPFDAELVEHHRGKKLEVTIKAIFRHDPHEKVGVVGLKNNKIGICEYSEMKDDTPSFNIANTGLFCFSLDFIEQVACCSLPWHLARKTATILMGTAKGACLETVQVWKFETFIFDLLAFAERVDVLIYPSEEIYSPLKNLTGNKSVQTVQDSLAHYNRKILERMTGNSIPEGKFELDPAFYYPSEELREMWKGKIPPSQDYIEAKYREKKVL